MYETVKTVNGYDIIRMKGTRGFYSVYLSEHKYRTFKTQKAATTFCETLKK